MEVSLLSMTPESLKLMYVAARTCYSARTPQEILKDYTREKAEKLLTKVLGSGHLSVAEHVNFTFAISEVDRSLTHQLVRHRTASYCLAGDTVIKQKSHGESRTIKELFESTSQYNNMRKIRCVDENTHELQYDHIKSVVYSGIKPVYEVETEFGYKIKSTMQHMFFTPNGWKQLEEINIGDVVYVNGIPAYQDKEWLKNQYHILNKSQEEIGLECGVSKHTIRKWVRFYGLQKEAGSWTIGVEPPNKGRTKYDYAPTAAASQKLLGNNNAPKLYGTKNPNWKGDDVTISGGYTRTHRNNKKVGICFNCGVEGRTHFHHIDKIPKNASNNNIIELCPNCHKAIHKREIKEVILPNKIISVKYIGEMDTYDIEMAGVNHNFIANGFVVHNSQQSQRYVEIKESASYIENVLQRDDMREMDALANKYFTASGFSEIKICLEALLSYRKLIEENGLAPEEARAVLPNCTKTNIVMSCNLRELIHISNLRLCTRAQLPIRNLFREIAKLVKEQDSYIGKMLVPKCGVLGFCTEEKCCGRKPKLEEIIKGERNV